MKKLKAGFAVIIFLLGIILIASCFFGCCKPPARGTLEYAVINADIIAHGVITNREYKEFRDDPVTTHTIYTLSIDQVVEGNPNTKEVLIKIEGGVRPDGTSVAVFDGERGYDIQDELLACFRIPENTYFSVIQGGTWIKGKNISSRESFQKHLGKILKIMYANDLPISLPKSEWPSYPTGPFLFPWQK